MSRLLLIRHGQTTSNVRHALDTALPGAALTELGWSQAHTAGRRLAGEQDSPLSVVSSQALRARQTAAGVAAGGSARGLELAGTGPGSDFAAALADLAELEVTDGLHHADIGPDPDESAAPAGLGGERTHQVMPGAVPGISEIPAGTFEMRMDEEAHHSYHRTFADWLTGSMHLPVPGADTGEEVVGRYLSTLLPMLATAQRAGTDLAVVSHGAVIRLVAAYLGRVDPEFAVRTLLPNTLRLELDVPDLGSGLPDVATATQAGWKVTDWAGYGEPPRV